MRGYPAKKTAWMIEEHNQGRAYFKAMTIAESRIQSGNSCAPAEFMKIVDAFVILYKAHSVREEEEALKEIWPRLTEDDNILMCGMIERLWPPDITLYFDMIQRLESDLGIQLQ
jgi:hemerythrin-like domain-containing protein